MLNRFKSLYLTTNAANSIKPSNKYFDNSGDIFYKEGGKTKSLKAYVKEQMNPTVVEDNAKAGVIPKTIPAAVTDGEAETKVATKKATTAK